MLSRNFEKKERKKKNNKKKQQQKKKKKKKKKKNKNEEHSALISYSSCIPKSEIFDNYDLYATEYPFIRTK